MHYAGRDKQFRNNNSQNKEDFEFFAERWYFPTNIYLLQVSNKITKKRCKTKEAVLTLS